MNTRDSEGNGRSRIEELSDVGELMKLLPLRSARLTASALLAPGENYLDLVPVSRRYCAIWRIAFFGFFTYSYSSARL